MNGKVTYCSSGRRLIGALEHYRSVQAIGSEPPIGSLSLKRSCIMMQRHYNHGRALDT